MSLTNTEIKELYQSARRYFRAEGDRLTNCMQALACCDKIINGALPHSHYFSTRSAVKRDLYFLSGREDYYHGSLEDITRAIQLNPSVGGYYLARALIAFRRADHIDTQRIANLEAAISDFNECLLRDPRNEDVWLNLIATHIVLGHLDDAISLYGQCKPYIQNKFNQLARSFLGCVSLALSGDPLDREDTEDLYNTSIKFDYYHYREENVIVFIGKLKDGVFSQGQIDKARRIAAVFAEHQNNPCKKVGILTRANLKEEALQACEMADEDSAPEDLLRSRCYLLIEFKRYQESDGIYDKLIERNPGSLYGWLGKSITLNKMQRYGEALRCSEEALKINPEYPNCWREKGAALTGLCRYAEAIEVLDHAIELSPTSYEFLYFKGLALKAYGRAEEALRYFEKSIEVKSDYEEAINGIESLLQQFDSP